jgi:hypothetical protein
VGGEDCAGKRIGDGAAKLVDVWRAAQMPNEQSRGQGGRETGETGRPFSLLSLSLSL